MSCSNTISFFLFASLFTEQVRYVGLQRGRLTPRHQRFTAAGIFQNVTETDGFAGKQRGPEGQKPGALSSTVAKLATLHSKHRWVKRDLWKETLWEGGQVRGADQLEQFWFKVTQGKGHFVPEQLTAFNSVCTLK